MILKPFFMKLQLAHVYNLSRNERDSRVVPLWMQEGCRIHGKFHIV